MISDANSVPDAGGSRARRLSVDHVSIRHDERTATTPSDVSFTVSPGEVVLILGPSGSGKSTLALALNGLIPHSIPATITGSVRVGDTITTESSVPELSTSVSMVFQDPDSQIVTGTVLDEVAFGPENLRLPVENVLARAETALRQVGLWDRRGDNPDRLSGGGRQRLAIACALALDSPFIVLDEPTANLDPAGIAEVYAVLAGIVATGTRAIVLIEHNLDAAIDLVTRVVVIDGAGRLVADGPTSDIVIDRVEELSALGVWLPTATIAALRLRDAGVDISPLPLTTAELAAAIDATTVLPKPLASPQAGARPGSPAGERTPAVTVRNLSVAKRGTEILHNISLTVGAGDFLAIVGTNGAGKTTLLQAVAGVVKPPVGAVSIHGLDPARADARALAAAIGFVFQNPEHQFIRTTVEEELAHGPELNRLDRADINARVEDMLDRFGLTDHRDVHPFLLSGGQKRRLSVGTALIDGAPVLALDEPTFGQDRDRASELLDILSGLNAAGTTVIVVTHDLQLVAEHASHVAVLRDGRLVAFDRTAAVIASGALPAAGLAVPPLAAAMQGLANHPDWRGITRMSDLPTASGGEGL